MEIENSVRSFRELIIAKTNALNTAKTYSCAWGKYLKHHEHISEPKAITAEMIITYLSTIEGLSCRCTAHSAIKLWYKWKSPHEESTKFRFIPYPAKPDNIPDHVTIEDFISLMQVSKNIKHKCILLLAYDCGLRVSEVINLKITDIDSKLMNVHIRNSKNRKSRILKLTTVLLQYLREYCREYKPTDYLFYGQKKEQYTTRSCEKILEQHCVKANIKHYKFHALRHGMAMALYETGGYSLETIRDLLGHENVKTTQIYARKNNNIIQKTLSPIELIFAQKQSQQFLIAS